jgi:hypothetical protein
VKPAPRQALDEAAADRIGNDHNDDGDRSRLLQHRRSGGCVWADEAGERRGLPAPHDMWRNREDERGREDRETWGLNCAACGLDLASPPGSRGAVL